MMRSNIVLSMAGCALAGLLSGTTALASGVPAANRGSLLALPALTLDVSTVCPGGTRYESIRHYPRHRPQRWSEPAPSYRGHGFAQFHGGSFDPDGAAENHLLVGFRAGQSYDAVQIGMATDWAHRSFTEEAVVAETIDPTGHVVTTTVERLTTSSHLLPVMGFIQVAAPAELPVRPYFGLGGGYEALFLNSENFLTGEDHSGNFGGWGWQAWGGASLPLGPRSSLAGEVFANTATVRRNVDRFQLGQPVRESVDVDGVGLRVGVQVGF